MAQMQQSVEIARPLEEVFAFVANSANDALWGANLTEVTKVSPGPLGVGSRFRYKARFAGREFELVREITVYEPNRRQAVKTISGPLRWGGTRTFEAIPGGTRVTLSGGGRAGGFFGLAEPLLLRAAQRSLRTDLATLKRLLEDPTRAS
jgi:uncharacterized membrane protein